MGLKNYINSLKDERAEAVASIKKATGKSNACVSRWVNGKVEPDYANQLLIAKALGKKREELF